MVKDEDYLKAGACEEPFPLSVDTGFLRDAVCNAEVKVPRTPLPANTVISQRMD